MSRDSRREGAGSSASVPSKRLLEIRFLTHRESLPGTGDQRAQPHPQKLPLQG